MGVNARIIEVAHLLPEQVEAMFHLMDLHYSNVRHVDFKQDLVEKHWVILLEDDTDGHLCGFSTQQCIEYPHQEETINVLYSGDTIIAPSHWGSMALPVAWGQLMDRLAAQYPDRALYWLLTSKGYRTYRFLPVFFHQFWPHHEHIMPHHVKALLDRLATERWGERYCSEQGLLKAAPDAQRMRQSLDTVSSGVDRDPHVQFFFHANPGYQHGDELVCLAPWTNENLKAFGRRCLRAARNKEVSLT